jgi:hypothetical protein
MPVICNAIGTYSTTRFFSQTGVVYNNWITQQFTNTTTTSTTQTIWNNWSGQVFYGGGGGSSTTYYGGAGTALSGVSNAGGGGGGTVSTNRQPDSALAREHRRAKKKAVALLLKFLTDDQRAEFHASGFFHVRGGSTGRRYRIKRGRVGNIDWIDDEGIVKRYCAHPVAECPDEDTMLAQALHLGSAANEESFIKIANVHYSR